MNEIKLGDKFVQKGSTFIEIAGEFELRLIKEGVIIAIKINE